ncbi:arylformamidase [Laceyella tengchongensis]|uniref:arylformamidase n=1 Tax=Laceyella tengchongensis TaxID=574699 RepID=UPI0012B9D9E5|nr:arylformamidase [Laceyella tengchongensis]
MDWYDISAPLVNGMPVWPGDTPYQFGLQWTKDESGSVNVGRLTLSTHTGTHIDAPYHFDEAGNKTQQLDLSVYMGPARVIYLPDCARIGKAELSAHDLRGVERLLIRTDAWQEKETFPHVIPHVSPDAALYLKEWGVRLLGVDVPSVDPIDSKELEAHHALNQQGIHILEGIVLSHVPEGDYELIALPLPIVDGDASPVRAVLRVK